MTETDYIQHFELQKVAARGRLLHFDTVLNDILAAHNYPQQTEELVTETIALTALFSSLFKLDGVFSVQAHFGDDTAMRSIFSDVTADGVIRGAATMNPDIDADDIKNEELTGHIVFTVDQGPNTENYQGVVAISEGSLQQTFRHYFNQSEQIPTAIRLLIQKSEKGWIARGVFLQLIPQDGGVQALDLTIEERVSDLKDDWRRLMLLLESCTDDELADDTLKDDKLLMRLFHEDGVILYDKHKLKKGCRCSRERVESLLLNLQSDELDDLVVNDEITADCEFCGEKYTFDPEVIRARI